MAAGPGNAAVPAALAGAAVVASDLTPELFDAGRAAAEQAGARLEWRVADAEGFIGQMLTVMRPYAAPPPPGSAPPPLWGREEHVRELLGAGFEGITAERRTVAETCARPGEFREVFKANDGPTIAAYRFLGDDLDRSAALDAALDALAAEHSDPSGRMEWEYLLVTAARAA